METPHCQNTSELTPLTMGWPQIIKALLDALPGWLWLSCST